MTAGLASVVRRRGVWRLLAAASIACAAPGPIGPGMTFSGAESSSEIRTRIGSDGTCQSESERAVVCSWSVARGDPGWTALAPHMESRAPGSNLVCVFRDEGTGSGTSSCRVQAWGRSEVTERPQPDPLFSPRRRQTTFATLAKRNLERAREVRMSVASAQTMTDLSQLVGAAPSACQAKGPGRICAWDIDRRTPGYGDLSQLVRVEVGALVLRCQLSAAGAPRPRNSCRLEEQELGVLAGLL